MGLGKGIGIALGVLAVAGGATVGGLKINKLNNDVEAKNAEIVAQQKENEATQNQYTVVLNNNKTLEAQLEEKNNTILSQQEQLQQKDITIAEQNSELENLQEQITDLNNRLNKEVMSITFTDYEGCCTFNLPVDTKYYCSTEYNARTYSINYADGSSYLFNKPEGTYILDIENKTLIKTGLQPYQYCINGSEGQYDTSTLISFRGETLVGNNGHTDTYFTSTLEFQFTFEDGSIITLNYTYEFDENGLPKLNSLDEENSTYTGDVTNFNILKEQLINNYSFELMPENPTMFKFSLNTSVLILDGVTMLAYV